jgi:hypothetical protein
MNKLFFFDFIGLMKKKVTEKGEKIISTGIQSNATLGVEQLRERRDQVA